MQLLLVLVLVASAGVVHGQYYGTPPASASELAPHRAVCQSRSASFDKVVEAGAALDGLGDTQTAQGCLQRALGLAPGNEERARVHNLLGMAFYIMDGPKALEHFKQAVALDPDNHSYAIGLGNALVRVARYREAIQHLKMAIEREPDASYIYFNLGTALTEVGMLREARDALQNFFVLDDKRKDAPPSGASDPTRALAHHSLGRVLRDLRDLHNALEHLRIAVKIAPQQEANLMNDLGATYMLLKENDRALKVFKRCIMIDANYEDCYINMANLHSDLREHEDAVKWFNRAFTIAKKVHSGHQASFMHELQCLSDWSKYDANMAKLRKLISEDRVEIRRQERRREEDRELPKKLSSYAVGPMAVLMLPFNAQECKEIAIMYAGKLRRDVPELIARTSWPGLSMHPERLRVAYVSANFGHHVAASTIQGVFAQHSRKHFEIWAVSIGKNDKSDLRKRIEKDADHFLDLEDLPFFEAEKRLAESNIHIIIDMDGYTQGTEREIFAMKPAPLQILLMGYVGTTGDPAFDYVVADPVVAPAHYFDAFTEKLLFMPDSYFVNDYVTSFGDQLAKIPDQTRAKNGLPEEGTLFCNFNRHRKFDPHIFTVWMEILRRTPGSYMWFLDFDGGKPRLLDLAASMDIPEDRLIFTDRAPGDVHLAIKSLCQLFLDSPVYNAHTTGTDALWAGVPVLSLPLDRMSSRVSYSLMHAIGCDEGMHADSVEEYIATAVRVHEDPDYAASLRECVDKNRMRAPLFNLPLWTSDFERALLSAWEVYASGRHGSAVMRHVDTGRDGLLFTDGEIKPNAPPRPASASAGNFAPPEDRKRSAREEPEQQEQEEDKPKPKAAAPSKQHSKPSASKSSSDEPKKSTPSEPKKNTPSEPKKKNDDDDDDDKPVNDDDAVAEMERLKRENEKLRVKLELAKLKQENLLLAEKIAALEKDAGDEQEPPKKTEPAKKPAQKPAAAAASSPASASSGKNEKEAPKPAAPSKPTPSKSSSPSSSSASSSKSSTNKGSGSSKPAASKPSKSVEYDEDAEYLI